MKKIGIVTIIDYNNYGNRLQNYAVQEILKKINTEPITIRIKTTEQDKSRFVSMVRKHNLVIGIKYFLADTIKRLKYNRIRNNREERFQDFSTRYINESNWYDLGHLYKNNEIQELDYIVIGSDQIWNPNFRSGNKNDFGVFMKPEKRIAFAPSIGVSTIDSNYEVLYKRYLSEIKGLSVREEAGADLIQNLIGIRPQVLLDPTLFLSKEEWKKIIKPSPTRPRSKYILTYFLGKVPDDAQLKIDQLVEKFDFEVVNLADAKNKKYYEIDPSEFLDFISNAEVFFTDSYHGSVFSIIFKKDFIVFNRNSGTPSMNSRIDTLLDKFKLFDRKWEYVKEHDNVFDTEYLNSEEILVEESNKAFKYLREHLELKENVGT